MKRCPECSRSYNDDSMSFCLDDGAELLFGPASTSVGGEPATAILHSTAAPGEAPTRAQIHTTKQTAILPRGAEAEPQEGLSGLSEKQSFSANRAAKPLVMLVVAVLLIVGGFFGYRYFGPTQQIESIAVMPFVNESGNPDVEYLSDGMTETLMSSLTQVPNLQVKPRSSVFRYKGKETDPKTIGKELNVQAILNGRLVQRGNDITLYVELIDVQKDTLIWKGDYSRSMANLVTLQSEVARDVSNKLKTKLSGADVAKVEKRNTANPEAYRLYLQGRFYWNKRTTPDIKRSINYFNQAIALDSDYALAYAGLADAWQVLPSYTTDPPSNEAYFKARTAALKALEIDAGLAEPHAALGVVLYEYDWKFAEAEKEFKRAIEIDPNYASAHQWYGEYLRNMGRFDESLVELKRAQHLDPLSVVINLQVGITYSAARRYDEAIAEYRKTLEIDPNFPTANGSLLSAFLAKEMYQEAIEQEHKLNLLEGQPPEVVQKRTSALKEAYRVAGARGYWEKSLELAQEYRRARGLDETASLFIAQHQVRLGNNGQALDLLEKAFESGVRDIGLVRLKASTVWDPLRTEPRFKELLRKVGLPE